MYRVVLFLFVLLIIIIEKSIKPIERVNYSFLISMIKSINNRVKLTSFINKQIKKNNLDTNEFCIRILNSEFDGGIQPQDLPQLKSYFLINFVSEAIIIRRNTSNNYFNIYETLINKYK